MAKKPVMRRFVSIQGSYYLVKNNKILPFKRQTIVDIYGKDIIAEIDSFDTFVSVPDHINYQESVNGDWNLYNGLTHIPVEGKWPNIEKLMKHIFWQDYRMGMEYMWNLYMNPKQKLPLLGLVSEMNRTGKSTFIFLIQKMFQLNSVLIDNNDLTDAYNGSWSGKLVACIDEKPDGRQALREIQKLKKLITSFTVVRKEKYQADSEIDNICKFIMASNDKNSMLRMEDENTRFWIIEVPPIDVEDHNIFKKLEEEIPYFLNHLKEEFKPRESRGRIYFLPSEFITDAAVRMQTESKPALYFEIEALIERAIYTSDENNKIFDLNDNNGDESIMYASPKDFSDALRGKYETKYIRKVLRDDFHFETTNTQVRYSDILNGGIKRRGYPYKIVVDKDGTLDTDQIKALSKIDKTKREAHKKKI